MTFEEFLAGDRTDDAILRNLQLIGEAVTNVPLEIRSRYPITAGGQISMRKILFVGTLSAVTVSWQTVTPIGNIPVAIAQTTHQLAQQDSTEIKRAVIRAIAKPSLPTPQVTKITVEGSYALASWLMGEAGGIVALAYREGSWQLLPNIGGGLPDAPALSQRTGIPVSVARSLLSKYAGTSAEAVAQSTEVPMEIFAVEETMGITVPERDTTRSAYGGQLRLYDVHIAKMFEITYFMCQQSNRGSIFWSYTAGGGSIRMGTFEISCQLASDMAAAYGLGKPERTVIRYSGEEGVRDTRTFEIPILNITGNKVSRWMDFVEKFPPVRS